MIRYILILFLFSCASQQHGEVEYFYGHSIIKSPQSKKTLARIPILVRRTIDPFAKKILEEIVQIQSRNKRNETLISYEIIQNNHFAIQDEARLIRGHAYFFGPDWKWDYWTIHFSQVDGSVIQGRVDRTSEGLSSSKTITRSKGGTLLIEEKLKEIDLVTYKKIKKNKTR